jgi:hypothetical protein
MRIEKKKLLLIVLLMFVGSFLIWLIYVVIGMLLNSNTSEFVVNQEDYTNESEITDALVERIEGVVGGNIEEIDGGKIVLVDEGTLDRHEFSLIDSSDVIVLIYDQESGSYPKRTISDLKVGDRAEVHYFFENGGKYVESIIVGVDDEI